jgi:hypothetical protein
MRNAISLSLTLFIFFCLLVATERRAFAYVDPGSGLLTLQAIASFLAGCGYFLRRKIRNFFGRSQQPTNPAQPVQPEDCDKQKTA